MKRRVISAYSMPPTFPLTLTLCTGLLLDRIGAPSWAWGVLGTLLGLLWLVKIVEVFTVDHVDIPGFGKKTLGLTGLRNHPGAP